MQSLVEPLVVSWGWGENAPFNTGSRYIQLLEWLGTNDPSAYLAVPAAVQFMAEYNWSSVTIKCHQILKDALRRISELTDLPSVYSEDAQAFAQMAIVPLPPIKDLSAFQDHLYQQYRIEVPCIQWNSRSFLRLSVQGYNTVTDIDVLIYALSEMLPEHRLAA